MIDDTIVEEMLEAVQEDEAKENKSTKCINKEKAFNTPSTSILKPKFARRSLGMFTTPTAYYQDLLTDFGSVYGSKTSAVFRTPCKTSDNCSIKSQNRCGRIKRIFEEGRTFDHCEMSATILHPESKSCKSGNDLPSNNKNHDPAESIDFVSMHKDFQESESALFVVPEEPETLEITTFSEDFIEDRPTCPLSSNIKGNTRLQKYNNICHETHSHHDLESIGHCKSLNIDDVGIRYSKFLKPHAGVCKQDNDADENAMEHIPSITNNAQNTFEIVHPKEAISDYSKDTEERLKRNFVSENCIESTGNSHISVFPGNETENIVVSRDMVKGISVIPRNVDDILEKDTGNMGHRATKGTSEEPVNISKVSSVVMTDTSQDFLEAKNEDSQSTEDSGVSLSSSIGVQDKFELDNKDDLERNFESENCFESIGNSHTTKFPETENIVSIDMVKDISVIPQNVFASLEKDTGKIGHKSIKGTSEEPANVPKVSSVAMTDASQASHFLEAKNEDSQNTEVSSVSPSSSVGVLDKLELDNMDGLEGKFESENCFESTGNSCIPEYPEIDIVSVDMVKGISVIPQNVDGSLEKDTVNMGHKSTKGTSEEPGNVPKFSSVVLTDSSQASVFLETQNEDSQNTKDGGLSSIGALDKFEHDNKSGLGDEVLPCLSEQDLQKIDERPISTDNHFSKVDFVNGHIVQKFSVEKPIEIECGKVKDNFMCIVNKEKLSVDSSENCLSDTEITVHFQQLNDKADVKNYLDGYSKSDDYVAKCCESKNVKFEAPVYPSTFQCAGTFESPNSVQTSQNILSSNTTQSIYEDTNFEQGPMTLLEDTRLHYLFNENTEKRKKKNGIKKGRRKSMRLQLKGMSLLSGGNCIQDDLASPIMQQYTDVDSYSTCMEKSVDLNDKNEQVPQKKKRGRPRKIKRGLIEPANTTPASNKFKRTSASTFIPKETETSSDTVSTFQEPSSSPKLFNPKETDRSSGTGCTSCSKFSPKDAKGSSNAESSFQNPCTSHISIPNETKTVGYSNDADNFCELNRLDDLNIFKEVTQTITKCGTKERKTSPVTHDYTEVGSSSTCMEEPVDLNEKNEQVLQKKKRGRPGKIKRGLTEPAATTPASNEFKRTCTSSSTISPKETEMSSDTVSTFQEPSTSPNLYDPKETESSSDTGCTSVSTFSPKDTKGSSDADSSFQKPCTSSHMYFPKETTIVDCSIDVDTFCELNGLDDLDIFKEVTETSTNNGTKKRRAKKPLVDERKKSRRRSARLAGIPVQDNPFVIEQATEKPTDSCYSSAGLEDFGSICEENSTIVKGEETLCHAVPQRKFRKIKRTSFGKPLLLMNTYGTILEPTDEVYDEKTVEQEVEETDNGRLNMFVDACEYTVPCEVKSDNETAPVFADVDVQNVIESDIGKLEESSSATAATDPPGVDVQVHSELDVPCSPEDGPPVKRLSSRRKRPVISKNIPKKKKKTVEMPQPMSTAEIQQLYLNRGHCPKVTKPNLLETIFEASQNEDGIKIGGKKLNRRLTFQCPWLPRKRSKKNKGKRLIGKNKKYKVSDQVLMDKLDSVLSDLDVYEKLLM